MIHMFTKLGSVTLIALLSLSPPQDQASEIAALKRQVQELRDQQAQMQRELTAIKNFLQQLVQGAKQQGQGGPEIPGLVGAMIPTAGEPAMGSPSAKLMVIEVSDYQCPYCKRQVQQTFPQLQAEYVKSGKVQYVFVDYPIAQLHPTAARSHEAAACAGDQGKFWEMHLSLFNGPIAKDDATLEKQAQSVGLDVAQFKSCLSSDRHSASIKDSVARMERLGIGGTPMTLLGFTPAPGQPMKVEKYIYGALPYAEFKAAIDALLSQ
jgi:protein-disulfide isomerase